MDEKERKGMPGGGDHNDDLGITNEYTGNRDLWDSESRKSKFKDSAFGDKKVITDEKTGELLHKSQNSAKKKYHSDKSKKWAKHSAEVDHKASIEYLHSKAKNNPFLKDSDLKDIANKDYNYQILSKSDNASKGTGTEVDLATHVKLHGDFAAHTAANMSAEFMDGASASLKQNTFLIVLNEINQVLTDQKDTSEAVKDGAAAIAVTAVAGGAEKLLIDTASHILADSGNAVLTNIVEMNVVGQVIVFGVSIGSSLYKYLNGDIDAKELTTEIALNAVTIGISAVATAINPIIGPIIGMIAVNAVSLIHQGIKNLKETAKSMDDYLILEKKIKALEFEAVTEISSKREKFKNLVEQSNIEFDSKVEKGLYSIFINSTEEMFDVSKIAEGLDEVLSLCGEKSKFHSVEEWENQLDSTLELSF